MELKLNRTTTATQRPTLDIRIGKTGITLGRQAAIETPAGTMQITFQEDGVWYYERGAWNLHKGYGFSPSTTPLAEIASCLRTQYSMAYHAHCEKNTEAWEGNLD